MQDSNEPQPLGSDNNYGTKDEPNIKYPDQEQKEQLGKKKFDTLIVFGQGPVKPVLLSDELTSEQKTEWEEFKKDPLHGKEPNFRVLESSSFLEVLSDIDKRSDISPEEKKQLIELKRQEWQNLGRFALNRWGRENALAAGHALMEGITNKLILSGGKTIPKWVKELLPSDRIENWPAEAELMKDIIVRRFGDDYQKKYGKSIETVIDLEINSTNTKSNFEFLIAKNPNLLSKDVSAGVLSTDFQMNRILALTKLFSISSSDDWKIEAQKYINTIAERLRSPHFKQMYKNIQEWLMNIDENTDLQTRISSETKFTQELQDPLSFAYFFKSFNTPETIPALQNLLQLLNQPEFVARTKLIFEKVGLNFAEFADENLLELYERDKNKFNMLITGLTETKNWMGKI